MKSGKWAAYKAKARRAIKIFIFASYPLIVATCIFQYWLDADETERRANLRLTMEQGYKLVNVLESYHSDSGEYPEALNALVPDYLEEFRKPPWGNSGWKYLRYNNKDFYLEVGYDFNGSLYPVAYFDSVRGQWTIDD